MSVAVDSVIVVVVNIDRPAGRQAGGTSSTYLVVSGLLDVSNDALLGLHIA